MQNILNNLFKSLVHVFLPVSCPVCGELGEALCDNCAESLLTPLKFEYNNFDVYAGAFYEDEIRQVILDLKYKGLRAAGKILGLKLADLFERPDIDLLIPVPLHKASKRYYNQAYEIASGLGAKWHIKVDNNLCAWRKIAAHHAGMSKREREELTSQAFKVDNKIKNFKAALVDDICTTGATLKCLAQACINAGAEVKSAYVIAKA